MKIYAESQVRFVRVASSLVVLSVGAVWAVSGR